MILLATEQITEEDILGNDARFLVAVETGGKQKREGVVVDRVTVAQTHLNFSIMISYLA